ncbi:MAG TPA: hypothetical protein PLZ51_07470, partial [Aggregatilineales bacterium]|nr:hypothetical protein [Aggregatilineales bacterium]
LSDGNTSAGNAPNRLLASAGGSIGYVCDDGVNVAIKIGDLFYTHLLWNSNLYFGKSFIQGDELGQLKTGSFSATCGHATQNAQTFHVHWGFPNTGSLVVEGWTLTFSDQQWRRTGETKSIYSSLRAGSTPPTTTCENYSYNGVVLFEATNCTGSSLPFSSAGFRNMPDHSFNDITSSIHVGPGWSMRIWQDADKGQATRCITGSMWDLAV